MGEKRPFPPGTPKDACWSFPVSSWNTWSLQVFMFATFLHSFIIFWHLDGGSCTVNMAPSTSQPNISLVVFQVPSPSSSFFWEIGSGPVCPDFSGGGKTEWIPWSIALDKWVRCSMEPSFVMAMKSSTNASSKLTYAAAAWRRCTASVVAFCSISCSNRCLGRLTSVSKASMTSLAVSEAAQKKGGDSHHPIWSEFGTAILMSSSRVVPKVLDGRTYRVCENNLCFEFQDSKIPPTCYIYIESS